MTCERDAAVLPATAGTIPRCTSVTSSASRSRDGNASLSSDDEVGELGGRHGRQRPDRRPAQTPRCQTAPALATAPETDCVPRAPVRRARRRRASRRVTRFIALSIGIAGRRAERTEQAVASGRLSRLTVTCARMVELVPAGRVQPVDARERRRRGCRRCQGGRLDVIGEDGAVLDGGQRKRERQTVRLGRDVVVPDGRSGQPGATRAPETAAPRRPSTRRVRPAVDATAGRRDCDRMPRGDRARIRPAWRVCPRVSER